jgi:uncharacterized protein (TIGR02145 family)
MKSTRTDPDPHPRWDSPNLGATNSSGFTGFPGGEYFGSFDEIGTYGSFWSSTETTTYRAWQRGLGYLKNFIYVADQHKQSGFSVRCLKDN